jgi:hypothetical protein
MKGAFRFAAAYDIAKLPPADQPRLLALRLSKATPREPVTKERKEREDEEPTPRRSGKKAVKASSVKCQLPSGYKVSVSGGRSGLSLEEAATACTEALKAMKRALESGLSARTFEAAQQDKSAKGGE